MKKFAKAGMICFWLIVWQALAMAVQNEILLATPFDTLAALLQKITKLIFWQTVAVSLLRIGAGFFAGFFVAVICGVLSLRFAVFEMLLEPLVNLLKAIPVVSFVVLLLIWWGSDFLSVAICFLVVFPNIYVNTLTGLKNTQSTLLEMARVFRIPFFNKFMYIYRPALKPFLYSGLNISLGMCWKSGVAAEVIGTPPLSIGEQLYFSKIYLDTAGVFAWTGVIILLSMIFEKVNMRLAKSFFEWEPKCTEVHIPKELKKTTVKTGIECIHLDKAYGEKTVLVDFSAKYKMGETYYITWKSGSGKTTLFRLLCGLEKAQRGEIKKDGSFGVMFQEDRLCEEYSALRNVEMVVGDTKRATEALLKLLEKEDIMKPCSTLSGGMKRRVALVRAMESECDYLLLDEPFTGMDFVTRRVAQQYIEERRKGRLIIIATHI